jgi:hypothetical protein
VDTAGRFLRIRSVVGRSTALYRGVSVDPATPREPSPASPLASILEMLRTLDGVSVTHARKAIVLARGSDEEELRIHVDVDPVSLPDLNFEGNPELAILALHALLPRFGNVELRDDDYTDIIDGTEPVAVVSRFQAKARADLAKIHATIGELDRVEDHVAAPPMRPLRRIVTIAVIVVVAVAVTLLAVWGLRTATRRVPLGGMCAGNGQCESGECLSPYPYEGNARDDERKSFTNGACTQPCRDNTECPNDMTCVEAMEASSTGRWHQTKRCMPLAWQRAPE